MNQRPAHLFTDTQSKIHVYQRVVIVMFIFYYLIFNISKIGSDQNNELL